MTRHLRASALLLGSLSLSACTPPPVNTGFTVSGYVLAPSASGQSSADTVYPQALSAATWSAPHVAGQVLLRSAQGGPVSAQSLTALAGVRVERAGDLSVAYTPSSQDDAAFANALQQSGLSAQPNYIYQALGTPNDPGYPGNAGLLVGAALKHQDYLTRIGAQAGWDALTAASKSLSGVKLAVLDTGADLTHPDLQGRLLPGHDFCAVLLAGACSGEANNAAELTSGADAGHGTGVSGILGAASNNAQGLTGLTWSGQTVLPVKVFGTDGNISGATTLSLVNGLNYAVAQGAKVVNLSLGFTGSPDPALQSAIAAAASADVLMVAAAGNTATDGLYYPASDPNVLAVGALGDSDTLACYSARPLGNQKALDLVAPGGNAGTGTANCYTSGAGDLLVLGPGNTYRTSAGTSEAAPQVSAAAALLRAARSDLSAKQIQQVLVSSAKTVAGGRLLDLGAAVPAALTYGGTTPPPTTPGTPQPYQVHVEARQGGAVVSSYDAAAVSGVVPTRLIYRLPNLKAGTYTLNATLTAGGVVSSGQVSVNLTGDLSQDILTH